VVCTAVGFEHETLSELPYARRVADHLGVDYHEYIVKPDGLKIVEKLVFHFDEPFADASMVPTYYVSKVTRNHVTVALSGDGGDESFAGYRRYYFDRLENNLRRMLPASFRKYILGTMAAVYPKADFLPRFLRAKTLLTNVSGDALDGYSHTRSTFDPSMRSELLTDDLINATKKYDPRSVLRTHFEQAGDHDPLWRIQYTDFKTYLPDDILTKVDRMSMAVSLETRVPLLDHKLVEFVSPIPSDLKLKGKRGKHILKESVRDLIPQDIIDRTKMGFVLPISDWFRGASGREVLDIVLSSRAVNRGLFRKNAVEAMWKKHYHGIREFAPHLWALLVLEIWHQQYVDGDGWRDFIATDMDRSERGG
jgi:asparagine synthase (glutamine-hydrolysing)